MVSWINVFDDVKFHHSPSSARERRSVKVEVLLHGDLHVPGAAHARRERDDVSSLEAHGLAAVRRDRHLTGKEVARLGAAVRPRELGRLAPPRAPRLTLGDLLLGGIGDDDDALRAGGGRRSDDRAGRAGANGRGLTREMRGWDGDAGERGHDDLVCGFEVCRAPSRLFVQLLGRRGHRKQASQRFAVGQTEVVVATPAEDVAPRGRGGVAALRIAGGEAKVRVRSPSICEDTPRPGHGGGCRAGQI